MTFTPQQPKPNLYELDQLIIKGWKDNNVFQRSISERPEDQPYRFYDGPPFKNGVPHYGSILQSIIKDAIPRFRTMKGKRVERRRGWDCHGIYIEQKVQAKLGIESNKAVNDFGIEKFIEACREFTDGVVDEWYWTVEQIGRRVDMDNAYQTMDNDYMESVMRVFKILYDKGLIYKGKRVSMYSTKLNTPISNFEVQADNSYAEINDPAITVKFKINDEKFADISGQKLTGNEFFLAWTTTPWTIPANIALVVKNDIEYAFIQDNKTQAKYVIAKNLIEKFFKNETDYTVIAMFLGESLSGLSYEPPFSYYTSAGEQNHKVYLADYVSDTDGTGIVHTAPEFGEEDFQTGQRYKLYQTEALDEAGNYTQQISDFVGMFYRDANDVIMNALKEKGLLFKKDSITHSVALCPRTQTPLIYKTQDNRFIDIQSIKQQLYDNNEEINWVPGHIKHGRFLKSLESAPDRCISRTRFRATPMPVWQSEDGERKVVGSREDIFALDQTGSKIIEKKEIDGKVVYWDTSRDKELDLHRPYIDAIRGEENGKKFTRVVEVMDPRLDSGSMPYAQVHYPFENKKEFEDSFPADFIGEGMGQVRAWFSVMHELGTLLMGKPAFKNVICTGTVIGNDGRKMSKMYGNYPDPKNSIETYGADAMRMSLLASPLPNGGDSAASEEVFAEAIRAYILPLWNAFYFFTTYANIDGWTANGEYDITKISHPLDKFLYAKVQELITTVDDGMQGYDLMRSSRALGGFLDDLTNWYIRRSRRRYWKEEHDQDKYDAYATLYYALVNFCQVAAPFMPFVAEYIYKELTGNESVHLTYWPEAHFQESDKELLEKTKQAQDIISIVLAARSRKNIRVRQPLQSITIGVEVDNYFQEIIADECNVKEVKIDTSINSLVTKICKPDGKYVGETFGPKTKEIFAAAKSGEFTENTDGSITVAGENLPHGTYEISYIKTDASQDIDVDKGIVVKVDWAITSELELEGYARDLVRFIQDGRKEADYHLADRIKLTISGDVLAESLISQFREYIQDETLSTIVEANDNPDLSKDVEIGGKSLTFSIQK